MQKCQQARTATRRKTQARCSVSNAGMFDSGACSVRAVRARASAVLRLPLVLFVVGLDQLSFVTVSFVLSPLTLQRC